MTVWTLQRRISCQLLAWSALSTFVGAALLFATPFWRGVGVQALVWGVIDAAIASFGLLSLQRKLKRSDTDKPEVLSKEARTFRRVLLINAGLDVLYVVGGVVIVRGLATDFAKGNGVGIVVQGGFLLLFDAFYALQVQRC